MNTCPHDNGYRQARATEKVDERERSVQRLQCPVCRADLVVTVHHNCLDINQINPHQ
ncbi:hypothetical protein ACFP7A_06030 [Sporolactobacillus kofuensis]|uniref:Uncharacterized protein n=1 Tax=Sporolactobacillus kofuensis TaxID=269672 RepID=A0ABW1WCQ5_9BACL|nr:hypothetical protein [Sporolactobacillus kofuensis]MCO7175093.1 hypothetical protein [Sporolactobacillus kofuensis]